jgi:hypothetical protein
LPIFCRFTTFSRWLHGPRAQPSQAFKKPALVPAAVAATIGCTAVVKDRKPLKLLGARLAEDGKMRYERSLYGYANSRSISAWQ